MGVTPKLPDEDNDKASIGGFYCISVLQFPMQQ